MSTPEIKLLELYAPLAGGVFLGWLLGCFLPKSIPTRLGQFLFWIGVPIGIVAFLRGTNLSGPIWIAPVAAWGASFLGIAIAWCWLKFISSTGSKTHFLLQEAEPLYFRSQVEPGNEKEEKEEKVKDLLSQRQQTTGSFLLSSMVGNTGYLGYPVSLALVGQEYFGWALFYDLLGSTLIMYGLGVAMAARFGMGANSKGKIFVAVLKTPALWSLAIGLALRPLPLPNPVEVGLHWFAWMVIALSVLLIGMRLSQLPSWRNVQQASISLGIKMLLVPLIVGYGLRSLGLTGSPLLVIVLQAAMPPAFATLIVAEAYNLDRQLSVTTLALGSAGLFLTLPIWLWLFGI